MNKKVCVVGLFPSLFGGMKNLKNTGQLDRLVNYYLKPYAEEFEEVYYFSTFDESLEDYYPGKNDLPQITVVRNSLHIHRWIYPFFLPFIHHRIFRKLTVARVFQFDGLIPVLLGQIFKSLPYIVTYGYPYEETVKRDNKGIFVLLYSILLRILIYFGLRRAKGIIVTHPDMEAYLSSKMKNRKEDIPEIHLIPNGVDTDIFSPGHNEKTNGKKIILFVGRLEPVKNADLILEAVSLLDDRENILVRFVGTGSCEQALMEKARILNLQADFRGIVPHSSLPELYLLTDVFVLPSLMEGQAKSLIEAMSCGVPCVVSDYKGNLHLINHEVNGLVFEVGKAIECAERLKKVFMNGEYARKLGDEARKNIINNYDISRQVAREMDIVCDAGIKP